MMLPLRRERDPGDPAGGREAGAAGGSQSTVSCSLANALVGGTWKSHAATMLQTDFLTRQKNKTKPPKIN